MTSENVARPKAGGSRCQWKAELGSVKKCRETAAGKEKLGKMQKWEKRGSDLGLWL